MRILGPEWQWAVVSSCLSWSIRYSDEAVVVAPPAESEAEYTVVTVELSETGDDVAAFDGPLVELPIPLNDCEDEIGTDVPRPLPTVAEVGAVGDTFCELDVRLLFAALPMGTRPVDNALGEVVRLLGTGDIAVTPVDCGFDGELELVGPTDGLV
ncbi:hypothetical protein LTR12_000222 [Friedmanniomyces endolithicus]|nr:hypothetical protein LTR12_000222 [Friedmanniomyces endolithicus]